MLYSVIPGAPQQYGIAATNFDPGLRCFSQAKREDHINWVTFHFNYIFAKDIIIAIHHALKY